MRLIPSMMFFFVLSSGFAQQKDKVLVRNPAFDETIRNYLEFSIPVISCADLAQMGEDVILIDAREEEEYMISHIDNAHHVSYEHFDPSTIKDLSKNKPVVVYCSIGYRSEKIGEKLAELGFTNVSNLYGSIFEWVNQGYPIVDQNHESTNKLHTYSRKWSRWVEPDSIQKEW